MAYIGNSPANTGNYQLVDDIASSFNGTLVSFALTAGGIAITPAKSGQILANINGVMQEPDDTGTDGFKVTGSNIVFSSAPASGDTFWAVYQGQNVDIGTPSDDVVDTAHIKDDAVTAAKLANSINTEIAANTAKTGITSGQASAITANTAKTGITSSQATAITAALPKAGGTMTGTTSHGDNIKSTFGTGNDGSVYSDGTNILVEGENADSEVRLLSDDRVVIGSKGWGESFAVFNDDGAVSLYYDGGVKLATTSTGVTVTGAVTATSFAGSGAALTGIPILAFAATGGTVSTITGYKVHTFTSSGTFTATKSGTVEVLIVAGGGGGASAGGGGGGGGGILHNTSKLLTAGTYTVTIGAGGSVNNGGGNSLFGTMQANGGGSGSGGGGGSGGGQGHQSPTNLIGIYPNQASADGMGYGNAGGGHTYVNPYPSGGGGGAGGAGGAQAFNTTGRNGFAGIGKIFAVNGQNTYYSGGGGGGYYYGGTSNAGGAGGGGATGVAGTANRGGGGGGGSTNSASDQKSGGSGIVVVRYVV